MSTYVTLTGKRKTDFSFSQDGTYRRPTPTFGLFSPRATKAQHRRGKVCPGCGCLRSVSNRCECNS